MNSEWALAGLDKFIAATERHHMPAPPGVVSVGTYASAAGDIEVVKQVQVVEQILNRIVPGWQSLDVDMPRNRWARHREVAVRCRGALAREAEIKQNLGENAPELSATQLHPWVRGGMSSLWQSGHYREAVESAIKKLNAETQNKVVRRDVSETDSGTYESVQPGAMSLAEGIFAGIRNPLAHEVDQALSEQEALEYLAALGVLACWVDATSVERLEAAA